MELFYKDIGKYIYQIGFFMIRLYYWSNCGYTELAIHIDDQTPKDVHRDVLYFVQIY